MGEYRDTSHALKRKEKIVFKRFKILKDWENGGTLKVFLN